MQITNTTDYALRIIDYLSEKGNLATEAELADNLKIPIRNISKIMNILTQSLIVTSKPPELPSEGFTSGKGFGNSTSTWREAK